MSNQDNQQPKDTRNSRMGFYMVLGIGVGAAIGTALHNVAMGVGIGVAIGAALGVAMGQQGKNKAE